MRAAYILVLKNQVQIWPKHSSKPNDEIYRLTMLQSLRQALSKQIPTGTKQTISVIRRNFHKSYDATREEQTCSLSDGRLIGFAEYGNPEGTPAFALHGSPGSRYDGLWYNEIARKLNMRIICPDRPGHGLSSFQPNRKLGDYPGDISQLAHHLGISKYHVFGVSGGGPYAIACAYSSPETELLTASVIAGLGHPASLNVRDDGWHTVSLMFLSKWTPGLLKVMINWSLKDENKLKKGLKDAARRFLTEEDRAFVSGPEAEAAIMASIKEAYAQGPEGVIRDCQIYAGPWDFELKDVQKKVNLFFGLKDDRAPPVFGRYLKQHLPNAELVEIEGMSHFNMELYDEKIMERILSIDRPEETQI